VGLTLGEAVFAAFLADAAFFEGAFFYNNENIEQERV